MVANPKVYLLCGALVLVLSFFTGGVLADASPQKGRSRQAEDFALRNLTGEVVMLSELRGDNVVLLFGTTWCEHCQRAMMMLEELSMRYDQEGTKFLFVAVRQEEHVVADFCWANDVSYDVLLDTDGIVSAMYGVKRVPTCVFIDAAGMKRFVGRLTLKAADKLISGQAAFTRDVDQRDYTPGII